MPKVYLEDVGQLIEFPDDMSMEEIQKKVSQDFKPENPIVPQQLKWYEHFTRPFKAQGALAASAYYESLAGLTQKIDNLLFMSDDKAAKNYLRMAGKLDQMSQEDINAWSRSNTFSGGKINDWLQAVAKNYIDNAEYYKKVARKSGYGAVDEIIGATIGGAPIGAAEWMANIPWAMMTGTADAYRKGDNEYLGALTEGLKRFAMGKIFEAAHILKKPYQMGIGAGTMALEAYAETGDIREAAKAFGSGALIMTPGKGGSMRIRDILKNPQPKRVTAQYKLLPGEEGFVEKKPELTIKEEVDKLTGKSKEVKSAESVTEPKGLPAVGDTISFQQGFPPKEVTAQVTQLQTDPVTGQKVPIVSINGGKEFPAAEWYATGKITESANAKVIPEETKIPVAEEGRPKALYEMTQIEFDKTVAIGPTGVPFMKATGEKIPLPRELLDTRWQYTEAEWLMEVREQVLRDAHDRGVNIPYEALDGMEHLKEIWGIKEKPSEADTKHAAGEQRGTDVLRDSTRAEEGSELGEEQRSTSSRAVEDDVVPKQEELITLQRDESLPLKYSQEEIVAMAEELNRVMAEDNAGYLSSTSPVGHRNKAGDIITKITTSGDAQRLVDAMVQHEILQQRLGGPVEGYLKKVDAAAKREAGKTVKEWGEDSLKGLRGIANYLENLPIAVEKWHYIFKASTERLADLLKKAESPDATYLDKLHFAGHLEMHMEMTELVKGISRSSSRLLGAGRIVHDGKVVSFENIAYENMPEGMKIKITETMQRVPEKVLNDLIKDYKKDVKDPKNIKDNNRFLRKVRGSEFWNVLVEATNINLLSSPNTHAVNFLGNVVRSVIDITKAYEQVLIGKLIQRGDANRVTLGEANARSVAMAKAALDCFLVRPYVGIKGAVKGAPDYIRGKTFVEVLKDIIDAPQKLEEYIDKAGVDPYYTKGTEASTGVKILSSDYLRKGLFEMDNPVGDVLWKAFDVLGATGRDISYGMLGAIDKPFKEIAYNGELAAQIYRAGLQSKFKTQAELEAYINKLAKQVTDYKDNIPIQGTKAELKTVTDIHSKALNYAREATWQGDLGDWGTKFNHLLVDYPWMRFAGFRFFKTPVNLLKFMYNHSPATIFEFAFEKTRNDLLGRNGAVAQSEAYARHLLGWVMGAAAFALVQQGIITGAHPRDQKQALLAAGIPEYSVRLGKTYVQYNRVDSPFTTMLAAIADMHNMLSYMEADRQEESLLMLALALGQSTLHKSYVQGLNDIMEAVLDPTEYNLNKLKQNLATSFMPAAGLVRAVTNAQDPLMREAKTVIESLQKVYAPMMNRPQLDWLGKEMVNPRRTGITISQLSDDPVYLEAVRLGISGEQMKNQLALTVGQLKMTPEEHWDLQRSLDTKWKLHDRLEKFIKSNGYEHLPDIVKEQALKSLISSIHTAASQDYALKNDVVLKDLKADIKHYIELFKKPPKKAASEEEAMNNLLKPRPNKHLKDRPSQSLPLE